MAILEKYQPTSENKILKRWLGVEGINNKSQMTKDIQLKKAWLQAVGDSKSQLSGTL